MAIGTSTGKTYEDEFDYALDRPIPSITSTMAEGSNKKPAGELESDSGTQVASSNKPIAPTWRDLRPDTYVPTEGAPSQQPKPEPKPLPIKQGLVDISPDEDWVKDGEPIPDDWERLRRHPEGGLIVKRGPRLESPQQLRERGVKPPLSDNDIKEPEDLTKLNDQDLSDTDRMVKALKGVLESNKLNDKAWSDWLAQAPESSNVEDRRQESPMDKLEFIARDIWNAYSKAWKSVLGTDNSIPQNIADEDVRKGRSIKPEHGAPGGPSGGGVPGIKAKIEDLKTGKRFVFTDEKGEKIGSANLHEVRGGKDLYVDYAYRAPTVKDDYYQSAFDQPSVRGSKSILEGSGIVSSKMLGLIKEHFPNAERAYGERVSGVMGQKQYGLQFVRLKEPTEPVKRIETPYGKYDVPESAMRDFELSLQTAPVLRSDKKGIRDLLMKTGAERAF